MQRQLHHSHLRKCDFLLIFWRISTNLVETFVCEVLSIIDQPYLRGKLKMLDKSIKQGYA